jgi:tol-pal system protein YbgF
MKARSIIAGIVALSLFGAAGLVGAALAQDAPAAGAPAAAAPESQWDKKRLERLDRNVERIENAIARMKPDKAPPNLIEPDPEVIALTARVDELTGRLGDYEAALRRSNSQLDAVSIELDKSRKAEASARADNEALQARVGQMETRLAALEQAAEAAKAQAAAQAPVAGDPAAIPAPGDPATDFKAAKALMLHQDFAGASHAFQDFLARWPDSPLAAEAHYQLGETYFVVKDHENAAQQYLASLTGWPKTKWAPDALVRLAGSLQALGHGKQACAAVSEFEKRYAKEAGASAKARAAAVRTQAKCAA